MGVGVGGTQSVRGNKKSFKGTSLTVVEGSVYHAYSLNRTTSEERAECTKGGGGEGRFPTALGRIDIQITRGNYVQKMCIPHRSQVQKTCPTVYSSHSHPANI